MYMAGASWARCARRSRPSSPACCPCLSVFAACVCPCLSSSSSHPACCANLDIGFLDRTRAPPDGAPFVHRGPLVWPLAEALVLVACLTRSGSTHHCPSFRLPTAGLLSLSGTQKSVPAVAAPCSQRRTVDASKPRPLHRQLSATSSSPARRPTHAVDIIFCAAVSVARPALSLHRRRGPRRRRPRRNHGQPTVHVFHGLRIPRCLAGRARRASDGSGVDDDAPQRHPQHLPDVAGSPARREHQSRRQHLADGVARRSDG